jgi:N-succinyldiaminopimelate aminotransferase
MPRYPSTSPALGDVSASVYSGLGERFARFEGEKYPLHVGDTWLTPAIGCRMEDLHESEYPGLHRYTAPEGWPPLLQALARRAEDRTGRPHATDQILIGAGATGALGAIVGALVDPGEEVLVLAPYWPLIAGIIRSFRGKPVPVPTFGGEVDSVESLIASLEVYANERTAAVYLNTPSNPAGRLIPREWLEALADWARARDLWILSDEVYEDLVYRGEHVAMRSIAPDHTISAHSFSKSYGMTGTRCGWLVGPEEAIAAARKIATNTVYSTPTPSQVAGYRALEGRADEWLEMARATYRDAGDAAAQRLGVRPAEGSTFLFLDVDRDLGEERLEDFLVRAADRGLLVAPGPAFGPYPRHIRLCFTAAEPAVVSRGVALLASLLGR